MPGVQHLTITDDNSGQRVDNFLRRELKGVPKTRVYRLLRKGQVRVNGGRIKPDYRLRAGDDVRVPPVRSAESAEIAPSPRVLKRLDASILHEDDSLLIINKPAGLAVHGGSGLAYGVVEALRRLREESTFLELAHRLDRYTSGCLVLCKRRDALNTVHEQFRSGNVDKRYLALLGGCLPEGTMTVNRPLARRVGPGGEGFMAVEPDGKPSRTVFTVRERFPEWTLVEAQLLTGRMHQIRAHAHAIDHPVAGDSRYGNEATDRAARALGVRRLFLHAWRVSFRDETGRGMTIEAPLPGDLTAFLERLRNG